MKNLKPLISFLLLLTQIAWAQNQHPSFKVSPKNIEEVFNQKNNKPVFLEAYLPSCGHCMAYSETFLNPNLKTFLEQNLDAYQLDLSQKENMDFLRKKKIYVYSTPTFLVFSPTGEFWNFDPASEDYNSEEGIKTLLNKALRPETRQKNLLVNFINGQSKKEDLMEIAMFTRYTLDTLNNIKAVNELVKNIPTSEYETAKSLKVIQQVMMDEENPLFDHFLKNIKRYYPLEDSAFVHKVAENVVMNSAYNPNAKNYSKARFHKMKEQLIAIGVPARAVATRFIFYEVSKSLKEGNQKEAIDQILNYYQQKTIPPREKEFWCNTLKSYNSVTKDCPLK